jgi:hypothetical protein
MAPGGETGFVRKRTAVSEQHPGDFTLSTNNQLAKRTYEFGREEFSCLQDHDQQDWQSQADQSAHSLKSRAVSAAGRKNGSRFWQRRDQYAVDPLAVHVDDFQMQAVPVDPVADRGDPP